MSLELRNVTKRVGADLFIDETNLVLEDGSFNILLGTTLAGKTTLMQLMAGLERPTAGEICFRGKNVTGVPVQKRNVAMVYQQFINYPNFTVYENIASPLRVAGVPTAEIKARVGKAAELLRLTPMLDRRPSELSGGQQQRTAIARALVKDCRPDPARRAARQSRLQAARGTARRAAAPLRRAATASSSTPPPSRPRRCCSAATPRPCTRAGSPSSARPPRSIASPRDLITARGLLRSADQHRAGRASAAARS